MMLNAFLGEMVLMVVAWQWLMENWKDFKVPSKNSTLNSKILAVVPTPPAYGKNIVGRAEHNLPE